jgi:hypothetical protein
MIASMPRNAHLRSSPRVLLDPARSNALVTSHDQSACIPILGYGFITLLSGNAQLFGKNLAQGKSQSVHAPKWAPHAAIPLFIDQNSSVLITCESNQKSEDHRCELPEDASAIELGTITFVNLPFMQFLIT